MVSSEATKKMETTVHDGKGVCGKIQRGVARRACGEADREAITKVAGFCKAGDVRRSERKGSEILQRTVV